MPDLSLAALLDLVPNATFLLDKEGRITHANALAARMLGYDGDELIGLALQGILPTAPANGAAVAGPGIAARRKDGSLFPADIIIRAFRRDGESGALASIIDLSVHRQHDAALARAHRALGFLSGSNQILLHATAVDSLLDDVCKLAVDRGGYRLAWVGEAEEDGERRVRPVAMAGDSDGYVDKLDVTWLDDERGRGPTGTAIRTGKASVCRHILTNPRFAPWRDLAIAHGFQSSMALPLIVDGRVFGAITFYAVEGEAFDEQEQAVLQEVAEDLAFGIQTLRTRQARAEAEDRLRRLAYQDFVTGLANRLSLAEFLDSKFTDGVSGALLFIDLAHFKEITDVQGYGVGDAVLRALAERLTAFLLPGETLCRIGGADFALAMPGADRAAAGRAAERLYCALADPIMVEGQGFSLGPKIGIALYPGSSPGELCARAGLASRDALVALDGYRFYEPGMSEALSARLEIARGLKAAMTDGNFELHFQPKLEFRSGRLIGAEALLRWTHPAKGPIGPDQFIPVAEERGLMPHLGAWVTEAACRQLRAWRQAGLIFPGRLAVNVSSRQFDEPNFVGVLAEILGREKCHPAEFELELTESTLARDADALIGTLGRLTAMGFTIAIDDFGTGFSSLAYLSRFPASTLKIDMSFVRNMLSNPPDLVIVKTIAGMADNLGLATVAEGVETAEQAEALRSLGCTGAQGFFYGRPLPPAEFASRWLKPQP